MINLTHNLKYIKKKNLSIMNRLNKKLIAKKCGLGY